MIKCAVFDLDGTLVDSMPMWQNITYEYAELKGITVPNNLHAQMNRRSLEQCAELYISLGAAGTVDDVVRELSELAYRAYSEKIDEKPNAANFLKLLHENGIKVAVATASDKNGAAATLKRNKMFQYVDYITTCADVGKSKSEPDIFLSCAEHFGALPNECVVFEDSAYALKTAISAGFPVVAVSDDISMSGNTADETPAGIRTLASRCISDYAELINELTPPEDNDFSAALHKATQR